MSNSNTFIDKKGRKILIEGDYDVYAQHNGKEIGRIGVDEDDGHPILWSMDVDENYRRAGIAKEMMKLVAIMHGKNIGKPDFNAQGGKDAEAHTYYTEEGSGLIQHCVDMGILDNTEYPNPYDDIY